MAETNEQIIIRNIFLAKMRKLTLQTAGYKDISFPKGSFMPLALERIKC